MSARCLRERLLLLGLVGLAFTLRLYRLSYQSLWRDEVDTLLFATRTLPELLATFRKPGENGPLFFLAMRPWLAAVGQSEFALRFPSAAAGVLAVPILYQLASRLLGKKPAWLTALWAATAPYLVWYGQEAKMYALLVVLVPLALWLTWRVGHEGRWWQWVLLYLVTTLGFYIHVLTVLVVPLEALWLVIGWIRRPAGQGMRRQRWLAASVYFAALVLPYLPMAWWQIKLWLSPTFATGHPFVPLPDILAVLAVAFSRGVIPVREPLTLLPYLLALAAGVWLWSSLAGAEVASAQQEKGRSIAWLVSWLLFPPLALYLISLGMPLFTDRYLIWAMPAFLALTAAGCVALVRAWWPLGLATVGAILALNLAGVWQQTHQPIKADFRSAARFVLSHMQPDDLLIFQIPYNRRVFRYYSSAQFRSLDGPYTNNGLSPAELDARLTEAMDGVVAAWLIASEVPLWDQRGLTEAWLAAHGVVTDHAEFTRVAVTRYRLREMSVAWPPDPARGQVP
jgi:uncharacterized membrane protein